MEMQKTLDNPGQRLHDRLMLGFSAPDHELFVLAHNFRKWADNGPLQALAWLPKLRRVKHNPITAHLWAAVEKIVEAHPQILPSPAPACPQKSVTHETVPPVYSRPVEMQQANFSEESLNLSQKYLTWRKTILTESALNELHTFAPVRVREARDLEARSDDTQDPAQRRAILQSAARNWAALLNIEELTL